MPAWLDSAWLARYLERELSVEETAWFEGYVLDKPELLAMIEADTHLRDALAIAPAASNAASIEPASTAAESMDETGTWPRSSERQRARGGLPRWMALAASAVLGLGIGWLSERALTVDREGPAILANPTHVVFDTLRGGPDAPQVEQSNGNSPYVLIDVAMPTGAQAITLNDGSHTTALSATADGFVSFLVARKVLRIHPSLSLRYVVADKAQSRTISLQAVVSR
jgi:hypothetical protein